MRVALKTKPLVISFERTPDGDYQLVRDGDMDAGTHFGFAFDMACKRLNISYKRRGYSGCATHSSSTFVFAQEVPEEALMAATVALAELPTAELARQLIEGGVFGPHAEEPDFSQFDEHTDAETLKEWAIAYYQANRIDDPESLACLERNTLFRFRQVAVAALQHNLRGAVQHAHQGRGLPADFAATYPNASADLPAPGLGALRGLPPAGSLRRRKPRNSGLRGRWPHMIS